MPEITLVTADDARLNFACPVGGNVLAAAEEAGFYLPAMCREGSCGQCAAHVARGAYTLGACAADALPQGEGGVLLCRCAPESDLTVQLPYPETRVLRHKVPERVAVIEAMEPAGAGAVALTLRLQADAQYGLAADFTPGQFMELTIPGTQTRRAYSLANLPNWEGRLDFIIRLVPGGAFSSWLAGTAALGDEVQLRGPLGSFVLDESSPRSRCLVGGGCGMAPVMSMLRHMGEFQDSTPVQLIFGANREDELFPAEDIAALRAALPQLRVTLAVWHPGPGWNGFTGTTAEALAVYLEQDNNPDIYVCGPPRMLDAVTAAARAKGVPEGQIIAERIQS